MTLIGVTEREGCAGQMFFEDPHAVVAVQTIGTRTGMSYCSRQDFKRFTFCAQIDENQIHNPLSLTAMSKGGAMPLYEFYCEKCEKSYTLQLRLTEFEKENYQCPKCKNRKIKKQISTFQIKTSKKS